ncbi:hypothetical protein BpHYR1_001306 [Brachionus plicatilis]|uniref:Uncharacterized protein n=1 Tax=Brachionus plicatilis TaxID=10195 RepID=A0A3M7T7G8_BRAPC|nr:hypothetical protein BpHYR1_001306 [Brachionus plicatilis]
MDCDLLDELKQSLCGRTGDIKKINYGKSFISSVETLTGNENDVEVWFNQLKRIAYANECSREEKGRKLPFWLKEKALNIWYD